MEKQSVPLQHRAEFITLSARQKEILSLAAAGQTDKEIGISLGISAETVRSHWKNLRDKFGSSSRTQILSKLFVQSNKNRVENLESERMILATENAELNQFRDRVIEEQRRLLELLIIQQNSILESLATLLRVDHKPVEKVSIFRSKSSFLQARRLMKNLDLRPYATPGANEVYYDGLKLDGVIFQGLGTDPFRLNLLDWPGRCDWIDGPVLHADRSCSRSEIEGGILIDLPPKTFAFGFGFHSHTLESNVSDVWCFRVTTSSETFITGGMSRSSDPGFLGLYSQEPITQIQARCGEICYAQIADLWIYEARSSTSKDPIDQDLTKTYTSHFQKTPRATH